MAARSLLQSQLIVKHAGMNCITDMNENNLYVKNGQPRSNWILNKVNISKTVFSLTDIKFSK